MIWDPKGGHRAASCHIGVRSMESSDSVDSFRMFQICNIVAAVKFGIWNA